MHALSTLAPSGPGAACYLCTLDDPGVFACLLASMLLAFTVITSPVASKLHLKAHNQALCGAYVCNAILRTGGNCVCCVS